MKHPFAARYQSALVAYLKRGGKPGLLKARALGQQACAAGIPTLEVARLHERTLISKILPGRPAGAARHALIRQAAKFFAESILPSERPFTGEPEHAAHLNRVVGMLSQRTVELAVSNQELEHEVAHRKQVEAALKKSERHSSKLLAESGQLQEQLRRLSRRVLSTQEEERREISRELHDVIAQTLAGINIRLASLKKLAASNTKGLDQNIRVTQRLVEKSVDIVHRFARDLRPAVLDDLGLVPALHTFAKDFAARTRIKVHLKAFAGVESLDIDRRTVLFRVAQEALTNVARHAKASRVQVNLLKLPAGVRLEITDDGRSFQVKRVLEARGNKHLGLLGMRERVEMVSGTFLVLSSPGHGTTIRVEIPLVGVVPRPLAKPRTTKVKQP